MPLSSLFCIAKQTCGTQKKIIQQIMLTLSSVFRSHGRSRDIAESHSRSSAKQDRRYHRSGGSRSVHATSKTLYQCHVCEASFVRDRSLRSHLRQHGIEPTSHSFISALAGVRPAQTLYKVCLVLALRLVFIAQGSTVISILATN